MIDMSEREGMFGLVAFALARRTHRLYCLVSHGALFLWQGVLRDSLQVVYGPPPLSGDIDIIYCSASITMVFGVWPGLLYPLELI